MLDSTVLEAFMNKFYGYGNLNSDYWFIGMEEGFNKPSQASDEISRRISQWHLRGEQTVENLADYHRAIEIADFFKKGANLQPTWLGLMRIFFSAKGLVPDIEKMREYQINHLGSKNGDICLMELLPLPSKSSNDWYYTEYSEAFSWLKNKNTYRAHMKRLRAAGIRDLISKHRPKYVFFYGKEYDDTWLEIAGTNKWEEISRFPYSETFRSTISAAAVDGIDFISMPHVTAHGWTGQMFAELGRRFSFERTSSKSANDDLDISRPC